MFIKITVDDSPSAAITGILSSLQKRKVQVTYAGSDKMKFKRLVFVMIAIDDNQLKVIEKTMSLAADNFNVTELSKEEFEKFLYI